MRPLFLLRSDREEVGPGGDVEHVAGSHRGAVDAVAHGVLGQELLLAGQLEDQHVAVLGADVDAALGHQRRAPDGRHAVVSPKHLPGLGVHAVDQSGEIKALSY